METLEVTDALVARSAVLMDFVAAIRRTSSIDSALLVGSAATGRGDLYSDLDFFLYADMPNWPRGVALEWLADNDLSPAVCYWTGTDKYHTLIRDVGVDLSIRSWAQTDEISLWPRLLFSRSNIIKDTNKRIDKALAARPSAAELSSTDPLNAYDGAVFHLRNCVNQLLRGEEINARLRLSGVLESLICVIEGKDVTSYRWREPSRQVEERLGPAELETISKLAFSSHEEMVPNLRGALDIYYRLLRSLPDNRGARLHTLKKVDENLKRLAGTC